MSVCIYIYFIHTYCIAHRYIHLCVCVHVYVCACTCMCACMHICVCMYVPRCGCSCVHVSVCFIYSMHTHWHTHTLHTAVKATHSYYKIMITHKYVCMPACLHVCVDACVKQWIWVFVFGALCKSDQAIYGPKHVRAVGHSCCLSCDSMSVPVAKKVVGKSDKLEWYE